MAEKKPTEISIDDVQEMRYLIIKNNIIDEVNEEEFFSKKYVDDFKYHSMTNIEIINYDKRSIRPYAMELLNSMSELTFVKFQKWSFFTLWFCVGLMILVLFKSNGSSDTIKALSQKIEAVQTLKSDTLKNGIDK